MGVEIELERLRGVYKRSRLRENILENAYRQLGKEEKTVQEEEEKLGCKFCNFSR